MKSKVVPIVIGVVLFAVAFSAIAGPNDNAGGVFDDVLTRFHTAASAWAGVISTAATWLFWTLTSISMIWTFGFMALRRADLGEFFAEFIRFAIWTGFFFWLLTNAPQFASDIITSLRQLASNASGQTNAITPSGVVDVGFGIYQKVIDNASFWSPGVTTGGIIIGILILGVLALVGVNMLLVLCAAWFLNYAGIFYLGFGGSRWTSDMAIGYYKAVLNIAMQLFTMVLLVGIGQSFIDQYYNAMAPGVNLKELGVMLVVSVILLALVNKLPQMLSAIVGGPHMNAGSHGAGLLLGGAAMAGAAVTAGASLAAAGAANIAGGGKALAAAWQSASQAAGAGGSAGAGGDLANAVGGAGGQAANDANGGSPLAAAMGGGGGGTSSASSSSPGGGVGSGVGGGGGADAGDSPRAGGESSAPGATATASSSGGQGGAAGGGGAAGQASSDQASAGNASGGSSSASQSGFARTASIAASAAGILATGIGSQMKNKAAQYADRMAARVDNTLGGRLAAEIRNPGAAAQDRLDTKAIDEAQQVRDRQALRAGGAEAREFLANGGQDPVRDEPSEATTLAQEDTAPPPVFDGDNIAANEEADPESEIAAFRDKTAD